MSKRPNIAVFFCGKILARWGDGLVTFIDWSLPSVQPDVQEHRFCEATAPSYSDSGLRTCSVTVTVGREFKSASAKRRFCIAHARALQSFCGALKLIDSNDVFELDNCSMAYETANDTGVSFDTVYTFSGGLLKTTFTAHDNTL